MRGHRRKPRTRGQALVELALIAPVLLILLVGGAQVGALLYAQVQVDTAAREAARTAAQAPNASGAFLNGVQVAGGYPCTSGDTHSACVAARNSSGLLDGTKFTTSVTADCTNYTCTQGTSAERCATTWVDDGGVTTSISFQVPVFVPILDRLLSDPNKSYRTVKATVTDRVAPCTVNQGN